MTNPEPDHRSPGRRVRDEQIAAEPHLKPLTLTANGRSSPVETHLAGLRHPVAIAGVVENGLVRPLDSKVKLPEHSRVIIVTSEEA